MPKSQNPYGDDNQNPWWKPTKIKMALLVIVLSCVCSGVIIFSYLRKQRFTVYGKCPTKARNEFCVSKGHSRSQPFGFFKGIFWNTFQCVDKQGKLTGPYARAAVDVTHCDK